MRTHLIIILCLLVNVGTGTAQCPAPQYPPTRLPNIFDPQQEIVLGDILAQQQAATTLRVLEDKSLSEAMVRVGDRLLQAAGEHPQVQYFVSDLAVVNAWSIPGRIYVTRKMIAFLRHEDDLAALLAHELGHLLAHQTAISVTAQLHDVLNVDSVGDRDDIFRRYQQLLDNWRKNPKAFKHSPNELRGQEIADQRGLDALARAGYRVDAMTDMFDRLAGTEGKTGNWFSDALGITSPDQRRLREMVKGVQSVPHDCIPPRTPDDGAFRQWQARVEQFHGTGRTASLHGLIFQRKLDPPLRDDLHNVAFSSDGRYVLAQDSGSIYVLTRQPLAPLFHIDAPGALAARFTPDSAGVAFRFASNRVETWEIASRQRTGVHEVVVTKPCLNSELSPDGSLLACVGWADSLALIDVATSAVRFERGKWENQQLPTGAITLTDVQRLLLLLQTHAAFTPDGRYFLAGNRDFQLGLDLASLQPIPLSGGIKGAIRQPFTFLGSDRLVALEMTDLSHCPIVRFPTGEIVGKLTLGNQSISGVTHGEYLLLRPIIGHPLGVFDVRQNKITLASETAVFDVYDDVYVRQQLSGRIALYSIATRQPVAVADLPVGLLGPIAAASVSNDQRRLAISERQRGAVWDVESGKRLMHIRGFTTAAIHDNEMLARFAAHEDVTPAVLRVNMLQPDYEQLLFEDKDRHITSDVFGAYILRRTETPGKPPTPANEGRITFELMKATNGQPVWRHEFPMQGAPWLAIDHETATFGLLWDLKTHAARDELNAHPELKTQLGAAALDDKDGFVQLFDLPSMKPRAIIAIETTKGAFRPVGWQVSGDWILLHDNLNRTLVYAADGKDNPRARFFGRALAASAATKLVAVENQPAHLEIYDTMGNKRDELVLPVAVALARFTGDGSRLLVVTRDQTAYSFDMKAAPASPND